jgi:tetratricopeptide (TPR) repeat protein
LSEPRDPGDIGSSTTEVGDGDSFDAILVKVASPPVAPSDHLAKGTVLEKRFEIVRLLGAGGMGSVYVARDLELGREVAIKVHRAHGGGARLRREAIAMARLAHPNVVAVFEVGELDARPFVVMEYVPGSTLRAWGAGRARPWRDVLAMLIAAGEGLAAAHGAGLVHRDFKPENVLVGADGRPRVGDFGLARETDSQDDAPAAPPSQELGPMTQTGSVLGTPAYMPPEQLAGGTVDARVDQFAFCVTTWEMLWGKRPFPGTTIEELSRAIAVGPKLPPMPSNVPVALRAALERGLAAEPDDRFPDMHALLAALRAASRRRRGWLIGALAGVALGGVAIAYVATRGGSPACDDTAVEQLPTDVPDQLRALGKPELADKVMRAIDTQQRNFAFHARRACVQARVDHAWSDDLERRSLTCLRAGMGASRRQLADMHVTATTSTSDLYRAISMPSLEACGDPTHLATAPPVPTDPARRDALVEARAELEAASVGLARYRDEYVVPRLARLEASPVHDDPTIAAGILFLRGMLALNHGDVAGMKVVADAYYAARAIDDDELAMHAIAALILFSGDTLRDRTTAMTWMRSGLADADRIARRSPQLAATLYLGAAHFAESEGDAKAALALAARVRELVPTHATIVAESYTVDGEVKFDTGDTEGGIADYERAIALYEKEIGSDSTELGVTYSNYAASLLSAARYKEALVVARKGMAILANTDESNDIIANARLNLGSALVGTDAAEAEKLLSRARSDFAARFGERSIAVAKVDTNIAQLAIDRGDYATAIRLLERALAIHEELLGRDQLDTADVIYNLCAAQRFAGQLDRARDNADRMIAIYAARAPGSDRHRRALAMAAKIANMRGDPRAALELATGSLGLTAGSPDPQLVAWAELETGKALVTLHRGAEARPHLTRSRELYDALHLERYVHEIDELTAGLK